MRIINYPYKLQAIVIRIILTGAERALITGKRYSQNGSKNEEYLRVQHFYYKVLLLLR